MRKSSLVVVLADRQEEVPRAGHPVDGREEDHQEDPREARLHHLHMRMQTNNMFLVDGERSVLKAKEAICTSTEPLRISTSSTSTA